MEQAVSHKVWVSQNYQQMWLWEIYSSWFNDVDCIGKISFLLINLKQIWITSPLPLQIVDMYNLNLHASDRLMVKLKFIS